MNNNLYVNANTLLELLECMYQANENKKVRKTLKEVTEVILDLDWKELKE